MRISQIIVESLFGIFDHTIKLKMDDRITIIHGPNSVGKTAILRLIDGLFNSRYSELRSIPFKEFKIVFDNGSVLSVSKTTKQEHNKNNSRDSLNIIVSYSGNGQKEESFALMSLDESGESHFPPDISKEILLLKERSKLLRSQLAGELPRDVYITVDIAKGLQKLAKDVPTWLKDLQYSLPIRFIQTQRLLALVESQKETELEHFQPMTAVVTKYSDELAKAIQLKLAEYATLSQSLDRTFPARLVKEKPHDDLTPEDLRSQLDELEEKRNRLIDAGLLDKKDEVDFQVPSSIDDNTKSVLSVYIKDVQQKLSVFDQIEAKIDLFKRIINERFSYKKLSVSKNGITFSSTIDNSPLSPSSLSSGEQHELVLLYEFLFKVKPDSLILIDEPEISLHVAWQEQFLRDLHDVIQLASFDVLIATHSPQIIYDRWDLTVELKGPAENGKKQKKDKIEPAVAMASTSQTE